jgi:hypothetical protein
MSLKALLAAWTFPAQSFNREADVIKAEKVQELLDNFFEQLQQKYEDEDLYTSRDVIRHLRYELKNNEVLK